MTDLLDLNTDFGKHVAQRLQDELVVWLTTVSADSSPQPRPVWFFWDNGSFIIYSIPTSHKMRHVARIPNVALHFDSGKNNEDIAVFLGKASIETAVSQAVIKGYLAKYASEIVRIGYSTDTFTKEYTSIIRVVPTKFRTV